MQHWVIISAAGKGARMQTDLPKQYLRLQNKTILEHTLDCFITHPKIKKIILVIDASDSHWSLLPKIYSEKVWVTTGGIRRSDSVMKGLDKLKSLAKPNDWVLVHDAVRPCLHQNDLNKLISELNDHPVGGLLASPVRDTLKSTKTTQTITIDRDNLWHALTPQMFRFEKLLQAMQNVIQQNVEITDEAQAIELIGEQPKIVEGRSDNIKVTYPEDLALAENILKSRID